MTVRIRLKRIGRRKQAAYRIVVADSRCPRDGRMIEDIGHYNPMYPKDDTRRAAVKVERAQYWISQGAQASERCSILLKILMSDLQKGAGGAAA